MSQITTPPNYKERHLPNDNDIGYIMSMPQMNSSPSSTTSEMSVSIVSSPKIPFLKGSKKVMKET